VQVGVQEKGLQRMKEWDPQPKVWRIHYGTIRGTELEKHLILYASKASNIINKHLILYAGIKY